MMNKPPRVQQAATDDELSRRRFIKLTGIGALSLPLASFDGLKTSGVCIVMDDGDPIAVSPAALWAAKELETTLTAKGIKVNRSADVEKTPMGNLCIIAAGSGSKLALPLLKKAGKAVPDFPEALGLIPVKLSGKTALLATGFDVRGLIYALLELADRVNYAEFPLATLQPAEALIEQPANKVRGLNRLFVSDVEDKPWFYDREMWPKYLTMLATQRFNRFNLSLGIGYDFLRNVTDAYFIFAYPFFLAVPGYPVHVPELPDAERDQNLKTLQYISEQTVARGMEFRLGLWMHGYEWLNSPNPNYTIKGLTAQTHAAYCRDALRLLLQACPAISGITFRVHGESGVNEGSYDFWKTVFNGIATCGRVVEIDMHSKGIDEQMVQTGLSAGVPLTISPKFWAEHMGMPYHQADIRDLEVPKAGKKTSTLMNLSEGSRSFMRYGYGDLLKENRKYEVVHRIWPGTQRFLLWGDPLTGAAQSKAFSFCGSAGVELMEPLSFKGRRGSGIAGDRCGYADATLKPRWDWEKYQYSLRVFGRTLYNPDTKADVWQRYLHKHYGAGANDVEQALAHATRILPTVLTAHGNSAANNIYWPEMYSNMPITSAAIKNPYSDTPSPKVFGNVSPMDPQLFLSINEAVKEMLSGESSGKYSPLDVANWIAGDAEEAEKHLNAAKLKSTGKNKPEYRRMAVDVVMQIGLGRFFAAKFMAGMMFAAYEQTNNANAIKAALSVYEAARGECAKLAETAKGIYKTDVTAGELPNLRGHWLDRLPAIDEDIANMKKMLKETTAKSSALPEGMKEAFGEIMKKKGPACRHNQPANFKAGDVLNLAVMVEQPHQSVILYYRHVNQGERFQNVVMQVNGNSYQANIPADYTNSDYPLQYYFILKEHQSWASMYPGFGPQRVNQPYYVLRQT